MYFLCISVSIEKLIGHYILSSIKTLLSPPSHCSRRWSFSLIKWFFNHSFFIMWRIIFIFCSFSLFYTRVEAFYKLFYDAKSAQSPNDIYKKNKPMSFVLFFSWSLEYRFFLIHNIANNTIEMLLKLKRQRSRFSALYIRNLQYTPNKLASRKAKVGSRINSY